MKYRFGKKTHILKMVQLLCTFGRRKERLATAALRHVRMPLISRQGGTDESRQGGAVRYAPQPSTLTPTEPDLDTGGDRECVSWRERDRGEVGGGLTQQ